MRVTATLILLFLFCGCDREPEIASPAETPIAVADTELRILSWNIESDRNSPKVIAEQLRAFSEYSIVTLQEVRSENELRYTAALGGTKESLISDFGENDRLMIVYDTSRLELMSTSEPSDFQEQRLKDANYRSPLIAVFRDQVSGQEFSFLAVHLERRNAKLREEQAISLREFARNSDAPLIAAGDFNMDYDFPTDKGNSAFVEILRNDIWLWAKPDPLVDTNWADRDQDGKDDYPDSMLDFCFAANGAKEWSIECDVVVRKGDFPDDRTTSDHRPIEITVRLPMLTPANE